MKYLTFISLVLISVTSHSISKAIEDAYEVNKLVVEYSQSSNTGWIRPLDCAACKENTFQFTKDLTIYRNNEITTLDVFMDEYLKATHFTIFINIESSKTSKIAYLVGK